ncbi:hypothetical protein C8R45DRAFT_1104423 [Mycena sanguinolenta]|nr:hypothetical protein C8R45DRAFT_1104423 [Mycena sanguinolenta]
MADSPSSHDADPPSRPLIYSVPSIYTAAAFLPFNTTAEKSLLKRRDFFCVGRAERDIGIRERWTGDGGLESGERIGVCDVAITQNTPTRPEHAFKSFSGCVTYLSPIVISLACLPDVRVHSHTG